MWQQRYKIATPGEENISTGIELTNVPADDILWEGSDSPEDSIFGTRPSVSVEYLGSTQPFREDSTDGYPLIGITPHERTTTRVPEGECSSEEPIAGAADDQFAFQVWKEFSGFDDEWSEIGDCNFCWKHKVCCVVWLAFLLLLCVICLLILPRPVQYCVQFTFDDENALNKVLGDVGQFNLKITNPNFIPVSLKGFEINAHYGGDNESKQLINVARSEYSIGPKNTLSTTNETYVFAQDSTDVVPIGALSSCSGGYRIDLTYDLVTSFQGCLSPFMCKSEIVLKSSYVNNCLKEDEWVCTKFHILG